jgi:hypothetical protein
MVDGATSRSLFQHGRAASRLSGRGRSPRVVGRHGARASLTSSLVLAAFVGWLVLIGIGNGGHQGWGTPMWLGDGAARPTPRGSAHDAPLGRPLPPPDRPGPHAFSATQPGSDRPVAYDPCRPIPVVVNNLRAPAGSAQLLRNALERMTEITGLQFEVEGVSTEVPTFPRQAYQPDRYGDRWAPVLVLWASEEEIPELRDAAGLGGSSVAVAPGTSTYAYVTGNVILDGPLFDRLLHSSRGWFLAEAIILHELGHLVGLDHVDDPTELMYHGSTEVLDFGAGDRTGLAALSSGACVPRL